MSKNQIIKPIEIKISTVVAVSIILHEANLSVLENELKKMTGGVSEYFDHEFAVIDVGACDITNLNIDWPGLIGLFKSFNLNLVAVRNAPSEMEESIIAHGLSIDVVVKSRHAEEQEARPTSVARAPENIVPNVVAIAPPSIPAGAMIVDTPVRAGQRIYARGADLIVTAVVNNGAELIADGSIHIYAPLRGRALAGASGDSAARIFALSMEAELLSIAGTYRTFENGLPQEVTHKPAQVRLDGDRLNVLAIHTRA